MSLPNGAFGYVCSASRAEATAWPGPQSAGSCPLRACRRHCHRQGRVYLLLMDRENRQDVSVIARLVIGGLTLLMIGAMTIAGWMGIGELGFPNAWSDLVAENVSGPGRIGNDEAVTVTPPSASEPHTR